VTSKEYSTSWCGEMSSRVLCAVATGEARNGVWVVRAKH
jgi:hypothetical protein